MQPRDFNPQSRSDGHALDRILDDNRNGNVRLASDYIMVVDRVPSSVLPNRDMDTEFLGCIVARPVMYMHEFRIGIGDGIGPIKRQVAESLIAHALMKGAMLGEREAHFSVARDNRAMQTFIESHGAVLQPDGLIYSLAIPPCHYPPIPQRGYDEEFRTRKESESQARAECQTRLTVEDGTTHIR